MARHDPLFIRYMSSHPCVLLYPLVLFPFAPRTCHILYGVVTQLPGASSVFAKFALRSGSLFVFCFCFFFTNKGLTQRYSCAYCAFVPGRGCSAALRAGETARRGSVLA
jgi:hypothetical protein